MCICYSLQCYGGCIGLLLILLWENGQLIDIFLPYLALSREERCSCTRHSRTWRTASIIISKLKKEMVSCRAAALHHPSFRGLIERNPPCSTAVEFILVSLGLPITMRSITFHCSGKEEEDRAILMSRTVELPHSPTCFRSFQLQISRRNFQAKFPFSDEQRSYWWWHS